MGTPHFFHLIKTFDDLIFNEMTIKTLHTEPDLKFPVSISQSVVSHHGLLWRK